MSATYMIFGDLHGRILPAFRIALAWQREHEELLAGLLQVGDLGYFPDPSRLDKATKRHAERDPLELGAQFVANRSKQADALFAEPDLPEALWFTTGNHEDYVAIEDCRHGAGCTREDFPVDYYHRIRCIRDGKVVTLPGGLRVGALWGIDDQAPNARRRILPAACIQYRSATQLCGVSFDVLLTHDAPRDAVFVDSGSEAIQTILRLAQPAFHFFGHYHTPGRLAECSYQPTQVNHMHGLEFRGRGGTAEEGSVGILRWDANQGHFEYVDPGWLRTITRHNWMHR